MQTPLVIAIDFDGTVCTHEYPDIGIDIGAFPVLKELAAYGNKLILFTMRSDKELGDAVNLFASNEIPLYGINVNPTQKQWTNSPKCEAQLYIDDAALGIPLITGMHSRPYVDWIAVRKMLVDKGII
jgi:hypothetical protein